MIKPELPTLAIDIAAAQEINRIHREMPERIRQAEPNEAFQMVATYQYEKAVAELNKAIDSVSRIQQNFVTRAYLETPADFVEALKDELLS